MVVPFPTPLGASLAVALVMTSHPRTRNGYNPSDLKGLAQRKDANILDTTPTTVVEYDTYRRRRHQRQRARLQRPDGLTPTAAPVRSSP